MESANSYLAEDNTIIKAIQHLMGRIFKSFSLMLLNTLFLVTLSFPQDTLKQNDKVIIRWLEENAISIQHVEAGNGFSDLQPFKKIFAGVKVVGLGEATHATREFFQFKHRLFEFLVREMNFNAFALEASTALCESINEYVLYGNGDLSTALTAQGYSPWDTEEFTDLFNWMYRYNKNIAGNKKIRVYGLDMFYNEAGRKKVVAYLCKYAPEDVAQADTLFAQLSLIDEKWPMRSDECKEQADRLLPLMQNFIQHLNTNKEKFTSASSVDEFERIAHFIKLMEQSLQVIIDGKLRTRFMAENLLYLIEKNSHARFIVSAHNRHINVKDNLGDTNFGHDLREKLEDQYYAILFETNQGSYQSRTWKPEKLVVSDFIEVILPPSPGGSLSWYLSRVKKGNLFLNLREPVNNNAIEYWLNTPQIVNDIQWIYEEDIARRYLKVNVKSYYDGILFIEKTTQARPTKNALAKASLEIGF